MNWIRFKYLLPSHKRERERDLQEELQSLAELAEPGELGSITLAAERARDVWAWPWDGLLADIRYAFRTMRKNLGFASIVIITLALGIGANSAVFSFADAILLSPLPVKHPSEILRISESTPNDPVGPISYPDYRDLRADGHSFSGLAAYRLTTLAVDTTTMGPPQMRQSVMVSDDFFRTLGVEPFLGRAFLPEEGRERDRDAVAILGYDFWTAAYGANRAVLGQVLRLNGLDFTIVGVVPQSFPGMDRFFPASVFVPLSMWGPLENRNEAPLEDRARHELLVWGRLRTGVSERSAQSEMRALSQNLNRSYPKEDTGRGVMVLTERQAVFAKDPSRVATVALLMAVAGLVLITACVNVANLALARARSRNGEIAIRLSIGAGTVRLLRQLMTENMVLALIGGLLGLAVGYGGILFLRKIQIPSDPPFVLNLQMNVRVLMFSLLAALVSWLLFSLGPGLRALRVPLVPALKGGDTLAPRTRSAIGRNSLVITQIAFAMVLLLASGALLGGFRKMMTANPGFRTDHLISVSLDSFVRGYSAQQTYDFYRSLVDQAEQLPEIGSITLTESVPLSLDQTRLTLIPEGLLPRKSGDDITELGGVVSENYFRTFRIGIIRGRAFTADDRAASPRVAIVNDEFTKKYWPNQDALGKRLTLDRRDGPSVEVVGVAKTVQYLLPWEQPQPYVYLPYQQNQRTRMNLVAEFHGDSASFGTSLRDIIRKLDPSMPVGNLRTVASYRKSTLSNWLVLVQMITIMGVLGLVLALVGLYGLVTYAVNRRTAEIGLRMAIGATRGDVLRLILRHAMVLAAAGISIGSAFAAVSGSVLSAALVGVGSISFAGYLAIPAALLIVSLAACWLPARRATMIDPIRALRCE